MSEPPSTTSGMTANEKVSQFCNEFLKAHPEFRSITVVADPPAVPFKDIGMYAGASSMTALLGAQRGLAMMQLRLNSTIVEQLTGPAPGRSA